FRLEEMRNFSPSLVWKLCTSLAFLFSPFAMSDALSSSSKAECIDLEKSTFCHSLQHIRTTVTNIPPSRDNPNKSERVLGMTFTGFRSCETSEVAVEANFRMSTAGIVESIYDDYTNVMREALPSDSVLSTVDKGSMSNVLVRSNNSESVDADNFRNALAFEGVLFANGVLYINYVSLSDSLEACKQFGAK
ncbi:MAG: hypothetical protein AAGA38_14775, partial [Pseudomonadota bacterium]